MSVTLSQNLSVNSAPLTVTGFEEPKRKQTAKETNIRIKEALAMTELFIPAVSEELSLILKLLIIAATAVATAATTSMYIRYIRTSVHNGSFSSGLSS